MPWTRGERGEVDGLRRAEQLLEVLGRARPAAGTRRCRRRRCRRRRTWRRRRGRAAPSRPLRVVQEAEVAERARRSDAVGRRRRRRARSTRSRRCRSTPRLASTATPSRAARRTHSTSRTGMLDATTSARAVGQRGDDVARDAAFERLGPAVEQVVDRARVPCASDVAPLVAPCRIGVADPSSAAGRARDRSGSGSASDAAAHGVRGIEPGVVGVHERPAATSGVEPLQRRLVGGRSRRAGARDRGGARRRTRRSRSSGS